MELTIRLQILCTILLLSVVRWGNAQFYGTYGRSAYLGPITFPQTPNHNQNNNVPLSSRVDVDIAQPAEYQAAVAAAIAASKQISRGSEQFSFDMFYVSHFTHAHIKKANFRI